MGHNWFAQDVYKTNTENQIPPLHCLEISLQVFKQANGSTTILGITRLIPNKHKNKSTSPD